MVISAVYRGYKIAKQLYAYGKPTVTGKAFVSKFPPQHRQTVRTILKGSEIAFTGGLVSDIVKDLYDDGVDHGNAQIRSPKPTKSNKFNQTRNRFQRGSYKYSKRQPYCKCGSKCRKCSVYSRRR